MRLDEIVASELAAAFVAGPWNAASMLRRAKPAVDGQHRWLAKATRDATKAWPDGPPRLRDLTRFLVEHRHAFPGDLPAARLVAPVLASAPMRHSSVPADLPPLTTWADVASLVGLGLRELAWLTNSRPRETNVRHVHYDVRWEPKPSGRLRLLEAPRPKLKAAQRALLHKVLAHVPTHGAAHGFVRGRSPRTFAEPHAGAAIVVRLDIADFFPSTRASRVFAIFEACGYPETIARLLTRLTTTRTPDAQLRLAPRPVDRVSIEARFEAIGLYRAPHLPQGAPTSPVLANLAAYRLDARLLALATSFGARYTRYADDLAFSGGTHVAGQIGALIEAAGAIVRAEGWGIRADKTRVMRRSGQQRLTGLVVNDGVGLARSDRKRLEAILFNALRDGLDAQNRTDHPRFFEALQGHVAYLAHADPARAAKVTSLFEKLARTREDAAS